MRTGGIFRARSGCTFRLIQGVSLLLAVYLFRHEIGLAIGLLRALGNLALQQPVVLPPADDLLREVLYILLNIVSYILFGFVLVYLIGGNLLPLPSGVDRWEGMRRFYRFFSGERRPVIRVQEGELVKALPPGKNVNGGLAIIDPNSAIVLEKMSMPAGADFPLSRVGRPGVVFIGLGERLRGAVSLRKHARSNAEVLAQTADGIEVKARVSAVFTLGQAPAVVKLAYVGDPMPYNVRVVQIHPTTNKITALVDELDDEDKFEVHRYAQQFLTFSEPPGPLEPADSGRDSPPFPIEDRRILTAVYSFARNPSQERLDQWTDLPVQVATDLFRSMMMKERYDALFLSDEADLDALGQRPPGKFRLQAELKPEFARRMRYMGVMSYQFIQHVHGRNLTEGLRVDARSFRISPVQEMHNSKILRDRGIKVVAAGFGELTPTDPLVYAQRLDNWRARLEQQSDMIRADTARMAIEIKSRARTKAQQEIIQRLLDVLQDKSLTDEERAVQLYPILQQIAAQPATSQLLKGDTFALSQGLASLLGGGSAASSHSPDLPILDSGEPDESVDDWGDDAEA